MKKISVFSLTLLILIVAASTITAFAASNFYVKVLDPFSSSSTALGNKYGNYWVGEIPIKIGTTNPPTQTTVAFCMNYNKEIDINTIYQTHLSDVSDTAKWRAISYLLTWNYPTTDNEASIVQVAIWRIRDGTSFTKPSWLSTSIYNSGVDLAAQADGKDVLREDDTFEWVTPSTTKADPGQDVTFQAKLADNGGEGRANVKVLFSATINNGGSQPLDSAYLSASEAFTDNQGLVEVTVTVPPNTPNGANIEVMASTKGLWVQQYLNVDNSCVQDLIGINTCFELTVSTKIFILANIMVVPESPLGALSAVGACVIGFAIFSKVKKAKKPN